MNNFTIMDQSKEIDLLIAFADLTNFSKVTSKFSNLELFDYITKIYELSGEIIENEGGKIIKFIGDESLSIFSESNIDKGVISLLTLKNEIEKFNKSIGIESQLKVKCHFGTVAIGNTGTKSDKRIDIMGNEVNNCAVMKSNGFAISAETFRKLNSETRKYFKKHTPPISYITLDERHKD